MTRPTPQRSLIEIGGDNEEKFEAAQDFRDWIVETFISERSELFNPDHSHLADANLGVLWTNCANSRNMRTVIGQAELMPPMAMGKWQRARAAQQIEDWFGYMPDFLLTFSVETVQILDDASFCALVEHELYHCAQKLDIYGMPKFREDGSPSFCIRGHDVEEFVGVVARYGAQAAGVSAMVEAANQRPTVGLAAIAGICGTCSLKAA